MMHRKQFILGSTGKGSGNYINGATLREVFHAPVKQVSVFPAAPSSGLAIERGELDGDCGSYSSIPLEWIKDGQVHAFVRFTRERADEIPESAVYIGTFAKADEQKKLLKLLNGGDEVGPAFHHVEGGAGGSSGDHPQGVRRHHEGSGLSSPKWRSSSFRCIR